jgi:hypothetical protein
VGVGFTIDGEPANGLRTYKIERLHVLRSEEPDVDPVTGAVHAWAPNCIRLCRKGVRGSPIGTAPG